VTDQSSDVEVFTQTHCSACRQVEAFLHERGVPFVSRDLTSDASALDAIASRGYMGTPVTRIGDSWIAGFNRKALERALDAR
jgi:glutaredoxin